MDEKDLEIEKLKTELAGLTEAKTKLEAEHKILSQAKANELAKILFEESKKLQESKTTMEDNVKAVREGWRKGKGDR